MTKSLHLVLNYVLSGSLNISHLLNMDVAFAQVELDTKRHHNSL